MSVEKTIKNQITQLACKLVNTAQNGLQKINLRQSMSWLWAHRWKVVLLVILVYAANAAYNYFFPANTKKGGPQLVTTFVIEKQVIPIILEASVTIASANIVDIRPQTTNLVSKIHIKEGQTVKAGELLFTLDDRASQANYEKAKAQADDALRQYERAKELFAKKFLSQAALDTSKTNWQTAIANAKAAEVALSYDRIRSPITGRAGVINVYPGSLVQAGTNVTTATTASGTTTTSALVTITQMDPINVQFTVPEKELPLIMGERQGQDDLSVSISLPGSKDSVQGKVYVIDNQVDPAIGAVRVKAQLPNPKGQLIPGQFVSVKLTAKTMSDALVIPTQAVVINQKGTFLYVVNAENKVDLKPIKVLYQYQGQTAVSGVNENDKIVVEGKQNLRPGGTIRETKKAAE